MLVLCCSIVFCLGFCVILWRFAPETFRKILFLSGFLFWVRSLLLRFLVDVVFCSFRSRDTDQVVAGHTPTLAPFWSVVFFLFVPPRLVCRPFWPCVLYPGVFSGCHSWPRVVLGISWNLGVLSLLAPSEALFWMQGGKGVSSLLFCGFCFPLLL